MRPQNAGIGVNRLTVAGLIVTLGIVYGDIGTSPLYVVKAILGVFDKISPEIIMGSISCVIWTLTLQTTLKYVLITLRADNKGEGGIFALFALIRRRRAWAYIFAIVGGSTVLSDGIITPVFTVTAAIEGFGLSSNELVLVVGLVLTAVFTFQQFGTKFIGKSFGPIMFIWFSMLGILGFLQIIHYPEILKSFSPVYAYRLLAHHPEAFLVLAAVFLATTGAEALYSNLGHVGFKNIRISWLFVKTCLIMNYLGQGAWVLLHSTHPGLKEMNPFFTIIPQWFLLTGTIIATFAAIIASQTVISGAFTLISEAIQLNFWPKFRKNYPTDVKGQVYIPRINWFLWAACLFVIWHFRESSNMEGAYGLAISITMLSTTVLLSIYLMSRTSMFAVVLFVSVYLFIETSFLLANLAKFMHGGWFTISVASLFCLIMYTWYNGRKLKNTYMLFVRITDYLDILKSLGEDQSVPKCATHLVYLTKANRKAEIEAKIIFSIINKQPKRADVYWFLHLDVVDHPDTFEYEVTQFIPGKVIKVDFRLGFKVEPHINQYFKQVLDDMVEKGEVDIFSRYESLRRHHINGDFQFVLIDRIATYDLQLTFREKFIISSYNIFKKFGIPEERALNLDTSNIMIEKVPLSMDRIAKSKLLRVG